MVDGRFGCVQVQQVSRNAPERVVDFELVLAADAGMPEKRCDALARVGYPQRVPLLASPEKPLFDKTWVLPDIEKIS